jgi:hypothetical protein
VTTNAAATSAKPTTASASPVTTQPPSPVSSTAPTSAGGVAAVPPITYQALPGTWARCTAENGTCSFGGTGVVAFGASGRFNYATLGGGGTDCTIGVFGDPAYRVWKTCFLVGAPPGFTTWTACAAENGTCSFTGLHEVAFGVDGQYFYRYLTGGTPCDVAVFGDPELHAAKGCYVQ